jgi:ketosteroid isomerase-like protein
MDHATIAKALFAALAAQDDVTVRALCTQDLQVRQNNGPPMDLQALLGFNAAVHRAVKAFRYEDAVRFATATGFVEEHAVRGTLPDGTALNLAVCVVAELREGKVAHVREYIDMVSAAGLIAALRA